MTSPSTRWGAAGAVGALAVTLIAVPLTTLPAQADDTRTLQLLNINDFHGRISMDIGLGLASTVQQQRAENPNSLLLSAGDNVAASLYVSSVQNDEPTIDYLNALGLQASAAGNHEFDKGVDDLLNRIEPRSDFPNLAANVVDRNTGEPILDPYVILEAPDGTRVAVIGSVTQETPQLTDPSSMAGVEFTDPVAATNKYAQQLSDGDESNGEADVIVAEYHEGVNAAAPESDPIVTGTDAAVDVIFTGHTHEEYVLDAAVPGEPGKTRPVMQTGNYGDNLGDVELTLNADNEVVSYTSTLHERAAVPSAEEIAADPLLSEVNRILVAANEYAEEQGSKEVTRLGGKITTGWSVAQADSKGGFDQRDLESTMGHLVADMYLSAANSTGRTPADIGIVNSGGLRDEFPSGLRTSLAVEAGVVKVADVVSVAPFANSLWTTELTGAQLKQVLEEQWQQDASGKMATRPYLHLGLSSNVTYTYTGTTDAAGYADRGSHIREIFVDGKKVSESDTFTVAIPAFLLGGGDNYTTLSQGSNAKDTALVDSDAFVTYLSEMEVVNPRYGKQAVKVENFAGTYDTAGSLTFNLSDLATRSYDVPQLTSLDVAVGGVKVGSVEVKDAAASVDLSLAGLGVTPGEHQIVLTDSSGVVGTEIRLTATFTGENGAEVDPTPAPDPSASAQPSAPAHPADPSSPAEPSESAVAAPGEGSQGGTGSDASGKNSGGGVLASTGFSEAQVVLVAGAVVLAGAALVVASRRRKRN